MSRNVQELVTSVKRYLISNTPIQSVLQGQPSVAAEAVADIEFGIIQAANEACVFAQQEHDFTFLKRSGWSRFTRGCPVSLARLVERQRASQIDSVTVMGSATLESIEMGQPELILPADPNGLLWDHSNIHSVTLPTHPDVRFTVTHSYEEDGTVYLVLGMKDEDILETTFTDTVKLSYAKMMNFRSPSGVKLINKTLGISRPIKFVTDKTFDAKQIETYGFMFNGETARQGEFYEILAVSDGTKVHLVPTLGSAVEFIMDGFVWADPLVGMDSTNEFLTYGFDFLKWRCVVDINHILLKYVPRQEGTIAPPQKQADEALMSMIKNDATRLDSNVYHEIK